MNGRLLALCFASIAAVSVNGFINNRFGSSSLSPTVLKMGLYDKPLPPRPAPDENRDRDEDFIRDDQLPTLFSITNKGREVNRLLPNLARWPKSATDFKFPQSHPKVLQLVVQTSCHWEDASWALEAHDEEMSLARMAIDGAQKRALEEGIALPKDQEIGSVDWDDELFQLLQTPEKDRVQPMGSDGKDQRRQNKIDEQKKGPPKWFDGKPDEPWLPGAPPRPIDDEPWFTG